jgi:hypothetical protein
LHANQISSINPTKKIYVFAWELNFPKDRNGLQMPNFEDTAPQVIQIFRDDRERRDSKDTSVLPKTPLFIRILNIAEIIAAIVFSVPVLPPLVRIIAGSIFIILSIVSFLYWIPELKQMARDMGNPVNMILKGMQIQTKSVALLVSKLDVFDLETLEFVKNYYDAALKRRTTIVDFIAGPLDKIGAIPFMASIFLAIIKIPEIFQQVRGFVPIPDTISPLLLGGAVGVILLYPFLMSTRLGLVGLEFESRALEEAIRRKKEDLKSNP